MQDKRGLYYYPFPANKRIRMYVRRTGPDVSFRMWNQDDEKLWEEHGWVPYRAIKEASAIYGKKSGGFDPNRAYDIVAANELLRDHTSFS